MLDFLDEYELVSFLCGERLRFLRRYRYYLVMRREKGRQEWLRLIKKEEKFDELEEKANK